MKCGTILGRGRWSNFYSTVLEPLSNYSGGPPPPKLCHETPLVQRLFDEYWTFLSKKPQHLLITSKNIKLLMGGEKDQIFRKHPCYRAV